MTEFALVVKGGMVVGREGVQEVDLGITDGRIAAIRPSSPSGAGDAVGSAVAGAEMSAPVTVAADGRYVLPGFVDTHVHLEGRLTDREVWAALLRQGVTTALLGQDGISYAPGDAAAIGYAERYFGSLNGPAPEWVASGGSVADFLAGYDGLSPVNVATFVPAGTVRAGVVGFADRPATVDELAAMRRLVEQGMADGALGLSTGLEYVPGRYAATAELIEMCGPVAAAGGVYISHLRSYHDELAEAVAEIAEIVAASGAAGHISHLRVPTAIGHEQLARARERGIELTFDSYPYDRGSTILAMAALSPELGDGGSDETLRRLRRNRAEIEAEIPTERLKSAVLASVAAPEFKWAEGSRIDAAAEKAGTTVAAFVVDILIASELTVTCVLAPAVGVSPAGIFELAQDDGHMVGSDGIYLGGHPHPRGYGAFAHFLRRAVERGEWRWAADHLSGNACRRFGLTGRGEIAEGAIADLVLVDPDRVTERATYDQPRQLAEGIDDVVVGGELVLSGGELTGATPGRAVRRGRA